MSAILFLVPGVAWVVLVSFCVAMETRIAQRRAAERNRLLSDIQREVAAIHRILSGGRT